MASFADFIAWPARSEVVIAELTPFLRLSGFTATGGFPNTYQVSLPRLTGTAQIPGGVYRRCVGVRENATALTERASIAQVDANASSWYWDEAAGLLYVRSSTGSDPDTFTAYAASVRFYVATTGIVLNRVDGNADTGIYHHPWLEGDLPTAIDEMEDLLSGRKKTYSGNVTLTNAHKFWNAIVAPDGDYHWKNKKIAFYFGGSYNGQALLRSQYATRVTMLVEDVSADEYRCQFTLKPLGHLLNQELPVTPFVASAYPNLGDGVSGTKKWLGWGRAIIRPDLTDTASLGDYTVADAAYQTLFAIHSVWAVHKTTGARTLLTLTTDYAINLTACVIAIVNPTYAHANYLIECDVTGKPDGAGSYLKTFSAVTKDILKTHLAFTDSDLDLASFTQADVDAPEELSVWIKSPRQLRSILASSEPGLPSLERSVLGRLAQTRDGKWKVKIWTPTYPATAPLITKTDFAAFSPEPKFETVYGTTRAHYGYDHGRQQWAVEEASDPVVAYLDESQDRLDVFTFLRSASSAQLLAQRYQFMSGAVSMEIAFSERGAKLAEREAGDIVRVTFNPAPSAAGEYIDRPFELMQLVSPVATPMRLSGRLGDLRGIGERIGRWMDASAPAWSAATTEERARSGFWSDSSGRIDPADPATLNRSCWW